MSQAMMTSVVPQIESLFNGGSILGLGDRQLVERFLTYSEPTAQAAFAALVARHGPMVLGLCRQLLGDHQLAEDAFQAVFFVLARRARSIDDPDLLANWLYGVAIRTARKAKGRLARERRKEAEPIVDGLSAASAMLPVDEAILRQEQAAMLHEEIDRLPRLFRLPLVLCYFEGLTLDEAAHRLRCPTGTVHSRLARARHKLRRGLTGRGVSLSTVALVTAPGARLTPVPVSPALCETTKRAAARFAAGEAVVKGAASAVATALAEEVLRSALIIKAAKLAALTLLLMGAVATIAGFAGQSEVHQGEKQAVRPMAARPDDVVPKPASGRMFVMGRVLDPQGRPVPNASVMAYARPMTNARGAEQSYPKELGRASSDGSGHFRMDVARVSSMWRDKFGAVALAPGYGAGWVEDLDPGADQPTADIFLRPEHPIQGRLFDLQGQPASNVKLSVMAIRHFYPQQAVRLPDSYEGPHFFGTQSDALPGWPSPVITGVDGRFTLHGVGPGLRVFLSVLDPRFARQYIEINTDSAPATKPLSFALQPARTITGRVTYADTGQPVPHAQITTLGFNPLLVAGVRIPPDSTTADAEGRFRLSTGPDAEGRVIAFTSAGQPYFRAWKVIKRTAESVTDSADLALPRGVMVRGKVTEQGSGRPVTGAAVIFFDRPPPNKRENPLHTMHVETNADGSFAVAVPARPGYLIVRGPIEDYVFESLDLDLVLTGRPGNRRMHAHAFIPYDPKPDGDSQEVNIVLRRGVTVGGQVTGPDGQPVPDAWMISRIHYGSVSGIYHVWRGLGNEHGVTRNGRFELHGLGPDSEIPVSFFEPEAQAGRNRPLFCQVSREPARSRYTPALRHSQRASGHGGWQAARRIRPPKVDIDGRYSRRIRCRQGPQSRRLAC